MELILERENWNLQKIKDYISDFKTTEEFHKSPKARAIISWVSKHRGPNGEKLYIKDLLSGLEKKGSRKKFDNDVTDQLKQQFPQWNFDNVIYRFPEKPDGTKLGRYLDGLYCPIEDEDGIPHGVSDNINVRDLKKRGNGCRECGKKRTIDSRKLDFYQWIRDFPKDKDYIFNIENFYYRTEGLKNKTAFVKDVICTKHNPPVVFAKNGVNIHNLRMGKTGCPVCGKSESKGEKKVREELERLGYDVSKQKTFPGCFGFGGTRYCDLLKFDAYIIEEDGTEVCIEYDGIQHYEPQSNWGGEEGLKSTQERDNLKTEYCEKNNIKLIRIPYWEFDNIGQILEYELGDSSDDIMNNNLTKEYIVTESQFRRILESSEEEKIKSFIKKYILSNFDTVKDVNFHTKMETQSPTSSTPSLEKKVIEVIFDRSKLTFVEMLHIQYEIREHLNNYFDLKTFGRGSEWELTADTQR